MSVTSVSSSNSHYYSGATRVLPYTFRIVSDDDLVVTVLPLGAQSTTTLTLGTQYSVSGVNFYSGGTITISDSVALSVGDTIRIKRAIKTYTQDTVFRNQGAFYAATVEDALDKLTMMSQELKLRIDSIPTFPDTETPTDYTFPEPTLGGFFKWATRTVGSPAVTEYYITSAALSSTDLPTIPLSKGGTGAITAASAWTNIGTPNAATVLPLVDGAAALVGTATKFAREDHVHPRSTLADLGAAGRGANTDLASVALTSGTVANAPASSTAIANKAYVDSQVPTLAGLNAAARGANTDITSVALTSGTVSTAPAANTDIANKAYVDGKIPSDKVRVVAFGTFGNIGNTFTASTISSTTISLPSISALAGITTGERVLVAGQSTTSQNGIYALTTGGLPWVLTRTSDWPASGSFTVNDLVYFAYNGTAGTVNSSTIWAPTSGGTVGSSGLTFTQVSANPSLSVFPLADGATPSIGTSIKFSREDHIHPRSTLVELGAAARGANTDISSVVLTSGTVANAPTANTDIVNKAYADGIAQGINYHQAVVLATTNNLASTLSGNVLTGNTPNITFILDNATPTIGERVLVKNQTTASQNGIYTVTRLATPSLAWQLTRATDYDSVGNGVDQITQGDFILVISGVSQQNTAWVLQTFGPITLNTTGLTFVQFAGSTTAYTAGTGLALTGTSFSLPTVPLSLGGTGQTTQQAALNALAGASTSGRFLRGDGTNVSMSTIQAADLPTVPFAQGGTGQITRQLGMNALAGAVTTGTFLRGDGTNVSMSTIQLADLPAGAGGTLAGDVTGAIGTNTVAKLGGYTLTVGTPTDFSTLVYNEQTNALEMSSRMSELLGYSASQPSVNIGVGSLVRQQSALLATATGTLIVTSSGSPAVRTGAFALHHGQVFRANLSGNVVVPFTINPAFPTALVAPNGSLNFSGYAVVGGIAEFVYEGTTYKIPVVGWDANGLSLASGVSGSTTVNNVAVSITHLAATKFSNSVVNGYASRFVDAAGAYQPLNFYPKYFTDDIDSNAGSSFSRSTVNYRTLYFEIDASGTYPASAGGTLTTFASSNIAIGASAGATVTTGNRNILIGPNSDVAAGTNFENVSIGNEAVSTGDDNVAIGSNANAESSAAPGAVAIGADSQGRTGVAVGAGANVLSGTAVGTSAFARNEGVAIGSGATTQTDATQHPPIAIGRNAIARSGQTVVGAQTSTSPINYQASPRSSYYGTGTVGTNTITLAGTDFAGLSVDMELSIAGATSGLVIITAISGAVITLSLNLLANVVAGVDRIIVKHPYLIGCDNSSTGALVTKPVAITAGSNVVTILNGVTTSGLKVGALFSSDYGFNGLYFPSGSIIGSISSTSFTVTSSAGDVVFAASNQNVNVVFDTRAQVQARGYNNNSIISLLGNYASRISIGACLSGLSVGFASFTKVLKIAYNADAVINDVEGITYVTISRLIGATSGAVFFQRQDYRLVSNCSISSVYSYQNILSFGTAGHWTGVSSLNIVQVGDKVTIDRTRPVTCLFSRNITAASTSSNQITFTSVKGMLVGMVMESINGITLSPFLTITAINPTTKTVTVSGNSPYAITASTVSTIRGTNMFALGWNPTWDNATVVNTMSTPAGVSIDVPIDVGITQIDLMFTPATGGVALGANSFAITNELALGSVGVRFAGSTSPTTIAGWLPVTAAGIEAFVPLYFRPTAG
jgi:hypothetical protein